MKEWLEKLRLLNREVTREEVTALCADLGPTPSIAVLEEVLKYYKSVERWIRTHDLLEWMQEHDLDTFENENVKVKIKTYVTAKVENEEQAFQWLDDHQYGDLIKDNLAFPRGEFTEEVAQSLEAIGATYSRKRGIHPQSLKKIISDRLEAGESVPNEDNGMNVHYFDECNVKEK